MVLLCLLQETHLASAECAALKIGGYQHVGQARTPHGRWVSILVREGVAVEVGVLEKKVPERATVTLRLSAGVSLTITSAYFPRKADVSSESLDTLLGAGGPLVVGADVNSHHVLWAPLRPSDDKGECIVDWCVQNDLSIANTGSATRRQPGTAALSSPDIVLRRGCAISNWKSTLSTDSDHCWITFDVFVGTSLDVIAPSKPARAPYAWNKARWNEFRKLSDEFVFRRMKRSATGVGALNEAVTRGIRMAAKRTIPKGKGVAAPLCTPELTNMYKMVQECKNERKWDALIRWRRKVLADTALGRWKENVPKLSATYSASWSPVKPICAPRPLTSPVLVVDGLLTRLPTLFETECQISCRFPLPHLVRVHLHPLGSPTFSRRPRVPAKRLPKNTRRSFRASCIAFVPSVPKATSFPFDRPVPLPGVRSFV
ncbi:hypothetical protein, conserved, partial [Trypanosoma vivax Y486]